MTEQTFHLVVQEDEGKRFDAFVARECPDLSRSRARRLIEDGLATINGRSTKPSYLLRPGDVVDVRVPPPQPVALEPDAVPLRIVYEDADLLVVDKPAGMTVHPAPGHSRHTLVNALLAHCGDLSGIGGVLRPGIVHRLDKDTSGLLLVAKNDRAHADLSRQLKEHTVEKRYLALVRGRVEQTEGVIEGAVGRDPRNRKRMAVVEGGRPARTAYRVREYVDGMTLVEVAPSTGRTHQIRVHLAAAGHPVVGDALYGKPSALVGRQFLHAYRLVFRHPVGGRVVALETPLPEDLRQALRKAGASENASVHLGANE
ncbi:MAG TPA: RluA family pseudouridine synthase [Dehalococcoidia bacterium]|nr:RluA family pseudouridine synthase [Dehalococcoidia bacterium]